MRDRIIALGVWTGIILFLWLCIMRPLQDIMEREKFAKQCQAHLDRTEPKIVRATLAWAETHHCLRPHEAEHFKMKLAEFQPKPHSALYRGGADWSVLHYEIRQAMRNRARDRAEKDLGVCRERLKEHDECVYLPKDWVKREQLYVAHFRISRCWDRPSKPLEHLQSEYRELRDKLQEFMQELQIE